MQELDKSTQAKKVIDQITQKINANTEIVGDWNNAIQFAFTDADIYWIKIVHGKVECVEQAKVKKDALVTVNCTVETLQNIIDNKLGSVKALITRKVKVEGSLQAIRELRQKVLGSAHDPTA